MSNERGWQNSLRSKKIHKSKKYLPLSLQPKSPSKNKVTTPSPGRSSPRPCARSLIVVLLRSATGRCGLIRPPGCKLRPLSYAPLPKILSKIPFEKRRRHAIPRPFPPAPTRSPVDCDVVGRWHQAEQSKSSAHRDSARVSNPRLPRFCPNCVAAGFTLRLTRTSYRKSGVANEAQGDGLSGDASSSL